MDTRPEYFKPAGKRQCKARAKSTGIQCKNWAMKGKSVCRFHGGKSAGQKTAAGKQRISESRTIHGRYKLEKVLPELITRIEKKIDQVDVQRLFQHHNPLDETTARKQVKTYVRNKLSADIKYSDYLKIKSIVNEFLADRKRFPAMAIELDNFFMKGIEQ